MRVRLASSQSFEFFRQPLRKIYRKSARKRQPRLCSKAVVVNDALITALPRESLAAVQQQQIRRNHEHKYRCIPYASKSPHDFINSSHASKSSDKQSRPVGLRARSRVGDSKE
jgi:hypothetical protein